MKKLLDIDTSKPHIITAALPYANGRLHIGHLVEYIGTDIYTRALCLMGVDAKYYCASDTHGTPIEVAAQKQKISPEELVKKNHEHNKNILQKYGIYFESFGATNTKENKELTEWFWKQHLSKGFLYTKPVELSYCSHCKRFLPDRYVKGECPHCGAPDQYGDVCEKCNNTHKTTDLKRPYCVICKKPATRKTSEHHFFKLSAFKEPLAQWLMTNKKLQTEVVNQVMEWVNKGLEDWCITRDEPYYGFQVPSLQNKYIYVWYDAPIGYISSVANNTENTQQALEKWKQSTITHIIGKDILYFHLLFWPAMLHGAGIPLPDEVIVHGHLQFEGEKMSKSRGTLIDAEDFLKSTNSELVRFYYAKHLSNTMTDIDFAKETYLNTINNELVSNIANFCYRSLSFCTTKLNNTLTTCESPEVQKEILALTEQVLHSYSRFDIKEALKGILEISTIGNTHLQDRAPWKQIKEDEEEARKTITTAVNTTKIIATLIKPILPEYSHALEEQIGTGELTHNDINYKYENKKINSARIVLQRVEKIELATEEPFNTVDLRVARIIKAEPHPNAEKLYVLTLSLGESQRTIVAGIRPFYTKEELLDKNVIVVANLQPANLRGVKSEGMLLAAIDKKGNPQVLSPTKSTAGESVLIEGIESKPSQQITIEQFSSLGIKVHKGKASYKGQPLKTKSEEITTDAPEESLVG